MPGCYLSYCGELDFLYFVLCLGVGDALSDQERPPLRWLKHMMPLNLMRVL